MDNTFGTSGTLVPAQPAHNFLLPSFKVIDGKAAVSTVRLPICAWLILESTEQPEELHTVPITYRATEDVDAGTIEFPDGFIRLAFDVGPVIETALLVYWMLAEGKVEIPEYIKNAPDSTVVN
jgi:hypothetical protein